MLGVSRDEAAGRTGQWWKRRAGQPREIWVVVGGGVLSKNLATHLKDVFGQVRKEGYVASAEGVGKKESLKVGAGNRHNFSANAVEVGTDGVFVG